MKKFRQNKKSIFLSLLILTFVLVILALLYTPTHNASKDEDIYKKMRDSEADAWSAGQENTK